MQRRLRGDHRQRRPDERRRVSPRREAEQGREPRGLRGAGVQRRRQRNGELPDHRPVDRSWSRTTTATRTRSARTTGALTEPGFVRVDIKPNGNGCRTVWRNTDARAPSVVPKMSTKTGLIYAYTRDAGPERRPRATTGRRSTGAAGRTVWQQYAGTGLAVQQQLRRPRARPRRHRVPGHLRRDRVAARRRLAVRVRAASPRHDAHARIRSRSR